MYLETVEFFPTIADAGAVVGSGVNPEPGAARGTGVECSGYAHLWPHRRHRLR